MATPLATIEQLPEVISPGGMSSEGPLKERLADQTAPAEEKGKSVDAALSPSISEQVTAFEALMDEVFRDIGGGSVGSPITGEEKRVSDEIAKFIATGTVSEGARVKPSTSGRIGGPSAESDAPLPSQLSEEIQRLAQDLLPDQSNATPEQRSSATMLSLTQHLGISGAKEMVEATRIIAKHERINAAGGTSDMRDTINSLMKVLSGGMSTLAANEFTGRGATLATSTGLALLRNLISVGGTTFGRQMGSAVIQRGIVGSGMSDVSSAVLGGSFAALPMILFAGGTIRAHMNRDATPADKKEGDSARAILAALSFATLLAGIFSGQLADKSSGATAQMIAFTLYAFSRDIVQSAVHLKNPNMERGDPEAKPVPDTKHWALSSLFYGFDQLAVNQLMPMAAPISGPSAVSAHLGIPAQADAAVIRAGINWIGETMDDLAYNGIAAVRDNKVLRLALDWEPKLGNVVNRLGGPLPARMALAQPNVIFGDVIDKALGDGSPLLSNLVPAIVVGAFLNGAFYWPFSNAGKGLPKVAPSEAHQTVVPEPQHQSGGGDGIEMSTATRTA